MYPPTWELTMINDRSCTFDGCERQHLAKGLCATHYQQRRQGRELRPLRPLRPYKRRPHGMSDADWFWARVNKTADCWEWTAGKTSGGYGELRMHGTMKYAHRVSYSLAHGEVPDAVEIDHQCRNRACVNPSHMRAVSRKQNAENLGLAANNSSGVRGVSWASHANAFVVQVGHNRKHHKGGYFRSLADAERAAKAMRNKLFTNNVLDRTEA